VLLGYSQATVLPTAQLASVFGVFGVSALVAGVSASLGFLIWTRSGSSKSARPPGLKPLLPLAVAVGAVLVVATLGSLRMRASELTAIGEPARVGLVQGNVDQAEKWDPARASAIFADYLKKTELALDSGASFVIWPEASTPFALEEDPIEAEAVRLLARRASVPILIGSNQIQRGNPTKLYNAAFLIGPDGKTAAVYRKMHLVPFGEYVPLKSVFFFASRLVQAVSDFSAGETAVLLPVNGHAVSTAICYEIVYPNLVRTFAAAGSELLTTITNDAWFGRTSAPYQHFAQASMRAVENGRYLVRAANTGISGVVDPYGRIVAESRIYEPAVIVEQVRFLGSRTIYTRIGDAFAYACVLTTAALLVIARRRIE
jgi:apolipoprotein N-acyltransferase